MLFVLTGSAGSGKSAALQALSSRRPDLAAYDFDELSPPPDASQSWWQRRINERVTWTVAEQARGRDTVLAGWLTVQEVLATPAAAALEGVAACLLDCADDVRLARIGQRAASGTWRQHTSQEVAGFLRVAARMRESRAGAFVVDTSALDAVAVAVRLDGWIARVKHERG